MWKLGKRSKKVYESGLHEDLQRIIDMACVACPIDFGLTSGVRTAEKQFKLFKIGRAYIGGDGDTSDPSNWNQIKSSVATYLDGYEKKSNHQKKDDGFGYAIDFIAYVEGQSQLMYDHVHMAAIIGSFMTCASILYHEGKITHMLRSGADWDGDTRWLEPGTFQDLPHLELIEP